MNEYVSNQAVYGIVIAGMHTGNQSASSQ